MTSPVTQPHPLIAEALAERAQQQRKAQAADQRLFLRQIKELFREATQPLGQIFFDLPNRTALVDGITLRQKRIPHAKDGYPDQWVLLYVQQCPRCAQTKESLPLRSLRDLKHYLSGGLRLCDC